ncbi:MAG: hypothetical protein AAFR96_12795 [Planctomycetota bacterium]
MNIRSEHSSEPEPGFFAHETGLAELDLVERGITHPAVDEEEHVVRLSTHDRFCPRHRVERILVNFASPGLFTRPIVDGVHRFLDQQRLSRSVHEREDSHANLAVRDRIRQRYENWFDNDLTLIVITPRQCERHDARRPDDQPCQEDRDGSMFRALPKPQHEPPPKGVFGVDSARLPAFVEVVQQSSQTHNEAEHRKPDGPVEHYDPPRRVTPRAYTAATNLSSNLNFFQVNIEAYAQELPQN